MWHRAGGTKGESEEHGRLGLALYSSYPLNHPFFHLMPCRGSCAWNPSWNHNKQTQVCMQPWTRINASAQQAQSFVKRCHGKTKSLCQDASWVGNCLAVWYALTRATKISLSSQKIVLDLFCKIVFKHYLLANSWATLKRRFVSFLIEGQSPPHNA